MAQAVTRAAVLGALALTAPAPAAAAQVALVTSGIEQHHAQPGSVYGGRLVLLNTSQTPQDVRIYQTDYLFFADGTNRFDDPGTMPRSNARWIVFGQERLTIPPGREWPVEYTVTVPDSAGLAGTYWSIIMIEPVPPIPPPDSTGRRPDEVRMTVRQVVRQAVQLVTHITGTGTQVLEFADPQVVTTAQGERVLQVTLGNVGERSAVPEVWVELYAEDGTSVGRLPGQKAILYPGTSVRQRIDLSEVPAGNYQALVVADAGDEVFGAQYRLRF